MFTFKEKRDGMFSSINPTELKSLFRKWPIINCKVVCCSYAFINQKLFNSS